MAKTFQEWRQSDESWAWPDGKGEPDMDTMLERAWKAGAKAEREAIWDRVMPMLQTLEKHIEAASSCRLISYRPATTRRKSLIESLCDWM